MKLQREVRIKQRVYRHINQSAAREADRVRSMAFLLKLRAAFKRVYARG